MNRKGVIFVLVTAAGALGGCGDSSTASFEVEPPGENCPDGGIRITTDDETYFACDGDGSDVSTEQVSAYDPDNPCDTNAVRITITRPDADPSVEYVCQGLDDPVVPELETWFATLGEAEAEEDFITCVCGDERPVDECETERDLNHEPVTVHRLRCLNEAAVFIQRPPGPGAIEYFECETAPYEELLGCLEPVDVNTCDTDQLDAAGACAADISDGDCDALLNDEEQLWIDTWSNIATELGCFPI